ncbi:MAG: efflux RND transporter permease subunit [Chloroflexota bacterium]
MEWYEACPPRRDLGASTEVASHGGPAISRLTELALQRIVITLLLAAAALVGGGLVARQLNVEMMPDLNFPIVTTIVAYPGASPQDVADQVTKPVEQAVGGVAGLKRLQSTSAEGLSIVVAEFEFGRDTKEAESSIQSALTRVTLPQNAQPPRTARVNLNDLPVVQISLSGQLPLSELRRIATDKLVPELNRVEGVYSVDLLGGEEQAVSVMLDPEKAAQKGVSFQQVVSLLQANSLALPGGSVEVGGQIIPVRTLHQFQDVAEVEEMVVGVDRGAVAGALAGVPGGAASGAGMQGAPSGGGAAGGAPAAAAPSGAGASTPGGQSQPSPPSQPGQHLVQPGDTVSDLARRYGTTVDEIARANGLANPDRINAGQKLEVPQQAAPSQQSGARRPSGAQPSLEPLQESQQPSTVRLKEIATVDVVLSPSGGISRTNGRPSVLVMVSKTQEANTVRVAEGVIEKLEGLKGQLGERVEIDIVSDESRAVESSLQGLTREAVLGMLFAVLVIFAFLWSPRGTLISAVSIPLSIALALVAMEWQGLTLNIMTLAGLAVAVGRVVDDSIVVLENAHRHVQRGEAPAEAARAATAEVAMPIAASTVTTVAVFLPLGLVGGIIGQAFRPFALTVTFALLASLLVALTLVPVLCRLFLRPPQGQDGQEERPLRMRDVWDEPAGRAGAEVAAEAGNGGARRPEGSWPLRGYTLLLRAALDHRAATLLLAAVLLGGSLSLIARIPTSFMPSDEDKRLMIQVVPPPGASREAVSLKAAEVERVLGRSSGVTLYQTTLGDETGALASLRTALAGQGAGAATILVRLEESADLEARAADLRESLAGIQGDSRISVTGEQSAGTARMQLVVNGQDRAAVDRAAEEAERAIRDVSGLVNLSSDRARSASEIAIQVNPSKAAELGLTTAQLAGEIRGMIAGQTVGQIEQGGEELKIRLSVPQETVETPEKLGKLPFGSPKSAPLSDIARIQQETRPVQITRVAQSPAVNLTGDIVAADTGGASQQIKERLESVQLSGGVSVQYGGVMEQMSEGFSAMAMGQLVGVGLVYLVMALFFNSLVEPLVILLSLPLAAVGAIPLLYVTGRTLSMSAMIGLLMLIGIVVTNAIVLLDFARRAMRDGRDPRNALVEAGRVRARPILMTALTTILALVPLAMGWEKGSIIAAELATVVIGGLFTSTLLTLVVVPVAYNLVRRR